jgi:hypothetical protein
MSSGNNEASNTKQDSLLGDLRTPPAQMYAAEI